MKKIDKRSILVKVMISMLIVSLLQTVVFYCLILAGGTVTHLNENGTQTLQERASWCAENIRNEMLTHWGEMEVFEGHFQDRYAQFLESENITNEEFDANADYQKKFIPKIAPELVQLLRQNKVNSVFLIFNGNAGVQPPQKGEIITRQGINIRDMDQDAGYLGTEDLFLDRAPASVLGELDIPLDSRWQAAYTFDSENYYDDYYNPLLAAEADSKGDIRDLGYWSGIHKSPTSGMSLISYSIPLIDDSGHIIGVAGVEIMENYLMKKMTAMAANSSVQGEYILAVSEPSDEGYRMVAQTGYAYHKFSKDEKLLKFEEEARNGCHRLLTKNGSENVYACRSQLKLYSDNTMFEGEKWHVLALLNETELYGFSKQIQHALYLSLIIALLGALVGGIGLSRKLVKPIRTLSREIKTIGLNRALSLSRTDILEIDQLVAEIEERQNHVLSNNRKLSTILDLAEFPIGALEIDMEKKTVFFTEWFFRILDYKIEEEEIEGLNNYEAFTAKLKQQEDAVISKEEDDARTTVTYQFEDSEGNDKWARIHTITRGKRLLGIILDVTREYAEKLKLQHERDHDLLTNLYNRRAFHAKMQKLFSNPSELGIAAMMMIDLDNLKYVNDSYGHDFGDAYIKAAASGLAECLDKRMLLARMSGDEFYVFLFRYEDKKKLRKKVREIRKNMRKKTIQTLDKEMKVHMTGGVAWYPDDAAEYDELVHYADFAMYQAKRYAKGEILEFKMEDYERDSYLLRNTGELNSVIEQEQVQYYFQPIVDARTGDIFAYEALIRPVSQIIKRPDELLNLAKSQGRLYQIEKLTWKKSLEEFNKNKDTIDSNCKIFINSISNQILNAKDFRQIEEENGDLLHRIVLEITEEERINNEFTDEKRKYLKKWNAELALDDFGSGYNGENLLLELNPNYVKVDMNIIRNIDKDEKRQAVFNNLRSYAKEHNIKVLAEGVETIEEFKFVRDSGADLIQGYLTGRPDSELKPLAPEAVRLFQ